MIVDKSPYRKLRGWSREIAISQVIAEETRACLPPRATACAAYRDRKQQACHAAPHSAILAAAMAVRNVKHAFNRLFLVLSVAWAIYCTIVFPINQRRKAFDHYQQDQRGCYERELDQGKVALDVPETGRG